MELPLALPAIVAGLADRDGDRHLAGHDRAADRVQSLGTPIFAAIGNNLFKTELLAAGGLAVALALLADGAFVLAQRALTPWSRAR